MWMCEDVNSVTAGTCARVIATQPNGIKSRLDGESS